MIPRDVRPESACLVPSRAEHDCHGNLADCYIGVRSGSGVGVYYVNPAGKSVPLAMPMGVSPQWGPDSAISSGGRLLAIAMLVREGAGAWNAAKLCGHFARDVLAQQGRNGWVLPRGRVRRWLRERGVEVANG